MAHDLSVRPFADGDVAPAGRLLAQRHARHRSHEPLLSPRFEDASSAEAEVAAAWACEGASGSVAFEANAMVGFLLGAAKAESTWGPNVWVEAAGLAVTLAETARDLYAHAAARWVDEGRTAHYVLVPSHDHALVDAWFRLGFGLQHVHAIREPMPAPTAGPDSTRRARHDDVAALADLALELPRHQGGAPVFSSGPASSREEALAESLESVEDPDIAMFVVERDDQVVGTSIGCAITKSGTHVSLARPDNAGFLGFAAVLAGAQGAGVGRELGEAVLTWAAEAGFRSVVTDWRSANLQASRAWPRLGFRPTFLRLHRMVGR